MRKWDYKHQVLATQNVPAWRVLLWVKFIEAVMQLRPRSLWRLFAHRDRAIRAAQRWYYKIGKKVWFHEVWVRCQPIRRNAIAKSSVRSSEADGRELSHP
jgi:hypothetical protein